MEKNTYFVLQQGRRQVHEMGSIKTISNLKGYGFLAWAYENPARVEHIWASEGEEGGHRLNPLKPPCIRA